MEQTSSQLTPFAEKQNHIQGDFRSFLQETLISRCKTNPAYSMRAFAKQLGLEASFLSKLISGKRKATASVIKKVALALSIDPEETESYIKASIGKSTEKASAVKEQQFKNLAVDHFNVIADWYHYAILELINISGFNSDPNWIAKKLGIKKVQVVAALERLERLEMIQKDANGNYKNSSGSNSTICNEFTASAFKKLQKQILLQAIEALEDVPFNRRDQSSMTMAINPGLIPEAKIRIKNFRRELSAFLEDDRYEKKEVYQLSLSLFPITKNINKSEEKHEKE